VYFQFSGETSSLDSEERRQRRQADVLRILIPDSSSPALKRQW